MITSINDDKLPPFPRDSKAPLDTPPAYSERPAPAPREAYPSPAPSIPSFASSPSSTQGAPQQFTHLPRAPHAPPSSPPRPADASPYQPEGSTKGKSGSAGGKFAKAVGQGVFALVAMPVVATAAALYGSGKLVEGIGKGLSAGPEAVLRAYKKMDGKIKGEAPVTVEDPLKLQGQQWHEHEHEHEYQYQQGETVQAEVVPPTAEESLGLMKRSLQMPMRGSLMEDPSIGMDGGSGSMRAKK